MSDTTAPPRPGERLTRWLTVWQAFLAFTGYVCAAGILADWMTPRAATLCLVINGGLNLGTGILVSRLLPAAFQKALSEHP